MRQKILIKFVAVITFCVPLSTQAGIFGPSNYWECILENIPGTSNDAAVGAIVRKCRKEFPTGNDNIQKESSLFGPRTADECIIENGKEVSGRNPGRLLAAACYRLYPKN